MASTVIEKVVKLLKLAQGNANPNEAAAATLKAQELMMQYNIEQNDIAKEQGKQAASPIGHEIFNYSTQKSRVAWQNVLIQSVAKMYFCHTVYTAKTPIVTLIGEAVNREATKAVYIYLRDEVLRLENVAWCDHLDASYSPMHHRGFFNQFCTGAVNTISRRLKDERNREAAESNRVNALVVVKDKLVTEATAKLFPTGTHTSHTYTPMSDAFYAGIIAGRNVPLKPGARQLVA